MTPRLRIPQVADKLDPNFQTHKVYVEEWTEGLPFADPLRVFRLLYDRVDALNHAPVKPATRAELLEVILLPYTRMVARHSRLAGQQSAVAFERYRDEADAARQVAQQFALGYKLLLLETANRRSGFGGQRLARLAAQRATQCLAYLLLHGYHQYLPSVEQVWPELYELYTYAAEQDFAQAPSRAIGQRPELGDSISLTYARVILIGATDPLHLPYGHVWRVFDYLTSVKATIRIHPVAAAQVEATTLILCADEVPRRAAEMTAGLPDNSWLLSPQPVSQALQKLPAFERDPTLRLVANTLASPAQRRSPRMPDAGMLRLAVGLSTVHHFSGGEATLAVAPRPSKVEGGDGTIDIEEFGPDEVRPLRSIYSNDIWEIENRSSSGACLVRNRRSLSAPLVGALVGVQATQESTDNSSTPWAIAVVRWLAVKNDGEHRIGIELLSSNARPVQIRVKHEDDDATSRTHPALVLASEDKSIINMVAPSGIYAKGRVVSAMLGQQTIGLKMSGLNERTETIDRFACIQAP
jgi:cyclic-di-GMP-binding protein